MNAETASTNLVREILRHKFGPDGPGYLPWLVEKLKQPIGPSAYSRPPVKLGLGRRRKRSRKLASRRLMR